VVDADHLAGELRAPLQGADLDAGAQRQLGEVGVPEGDVARVGAEFRAWTRNRSRRDPTYAGPA
jgi:hypothetical protein